MHDIGISIDTVATSGIPLVGIKMPCKLWFPSHNPIKDQYGVFRGGVRVHWLLVDHEDPVKSK